MKPPTSTLIKALRRVGIVVGGLVVLVHLVYPAGVGVAAVVPRRADVGSPKHPQQSASSVSSAVYSLK